MTQDVRTIGSQFRKYFPHFAKYIVLTRKWNTQAVVQLFFTFKTIPEFGFYDIQNHQGLGKCYELSELDASEVGKRPTTITNRIQLLS